MSVNHAPAASHSQQEIADLALFSGAPDAQNRVAPPTRSQALDFRLQPLGFVERTPATPAVERAAVLSNSTVVEQIKRRGRPRTREWWQLSEWAGMPVTRSLDEDEYNLLLDAAKYMGLGSFPPTHMYTLAPKGIDEVPPEHRWVVFHRERQTINEWLRRRGIPFYGFWVLESDPPTGTGQHMHLDLHLPDKFADDFLIAAEQRRGYWPVTDLRPASARPRPNKFGRFWNCATYVAKGINPKEAWGKNISRKKVGPICGKRCGVTTNVQALIDHWKAQRQGG